MFVPAHQRIGEEHAAQIGFVLHGVLGSGQNLRGLARELVRAKPRYAFYLVDLRGHGASLGASPPHTLRACAHDLMNLAQHLGRAPSCVLGHSLGGKVALDYARLEAELGSIRSAQVWVLDANPGAQATSAEVAQVIAAVGTVQQPAESRQRVVRGLLEQGLSLTLANWLATNLRREHERYVWNLELDTIEQLMRDFAAQDLWPFLEQTREAPRIHLVIAERTAQSQPAFLQRASALPARSSCQVHVLERAGHWLHVDNPSGLRDMILEFL